MSDNRTAHRKLAPDGTKWCNYGQHFVPVAEFGGQSYCRECTRKYHAERRKRYYQDKVDRLRDLALKHYGDSCRFCGESREEALTFFPLDEGSGVFKTLIRLNGDGWPIDALTTICYNCKHVAESD